MKYLLDGNSLVSFTPHFMSCFTVVFACIVVVVVSLAVAVSVAVVAPAVVVVVVKTF